MTDKSTVLKSVKLLAGLNDDLQDDVIRTLESMTRSQLAMLVDEDQVPEKLEPIIQHVVLARYNRLGNEGFSSYSQEGESINYPNSDFDEFTTTISRYLSEQNRGKIILW